jgi:methylmalonyl-CoA mutase N-terminal domain/subunit
MEHTSESGFPIDPVYDDSKLTDFRPDHRLGWPGRYPFTRGVYPRMYVDRPPAMRPYAGVTTAAESEAGQAGVAIERLDAPRDVWGECQPERI